MEIPYDKVNPIVDDYLIGLINQSELSHQLVALILPIKCTSHDEFVSFLHEYFTTVLHSKVDNAWDFAHDMVKIICKK